MDRRTILTYILVFLNVLVIGFGAWLVVSWLLNRDPDGDGNAGETSGVAAEEEADEYYQENAEKVIKVIDVNKSKDIPTEAEVVAALEDRGFVDCEVVYDYDMDGNYCGGREVSGDPSVRSPMYLAYYEAASGDMWTIHIINGQVMAYPASYNLEAGLDHEVIFSESKEITSYDDGTNQFIVTIPKESAVDVKVVAKIDAETIDKLTFEEISNYEN